MSLKPIASDSSYSKEARVFHASWIGSELSDVDRPCDSTYGGFSLDTLPPTVVGDDDDFEYIKHMDSFSPKDAANVQTLMKQAEDLGIKLPEYFIRLMSSELAQRCIPSCTACYFSLGESLSLLPDGESYVVRFLNDQQGCCFWYLHINKNSEHCVLCTYQMIGDEADEAENEAAGTIDQLKEYVFRCSPSFEDFIRRFYLENVIWFSGEMNEGTSTNAMQTYIAQSKIAVSKKLPIILALLSVKAIPRLGKNSTARVLATEIIRKINDALPAV